MKSYRVIIKCPAGFLTISDTKAHSPLDCLNQYKHRAVFSIQEKHEEVDHYIMVFAIKGSVVLLASKDIIDSQVIEYHWPKTDKTKIRKSAIDYQHKK